MLDKIKDKRKKIKILNNLSRLYWLKKDLDRAEKQSREALKLIEEHCRDPLHLPEYAEALNNLGNVYSDKEEFIKAEKYYSKVLKIIKDIMKN